MVTVSASEFAKNFGIYKEKAQHEPIAITSYDRTSGYFISSHEFEEYQKLKAQMRRAYSISELPSEIVEGIKGATMAPSHDHLNALLDD